MFTLCMAAWELHIYMMPCVSILIVKHDNVFMAVPADDSPAEEAAANDKDSEPESSSRSPSSFIPRGKLAFCR